jgi:hypothetical protein
MQPVRCCGVCSAAAVIQTAWRKYILRENIKMEAAFEYMYASVIQTAWRKYTIRENIKIEADFECMYAVRLQTAWRNYKLHSD